ncbi:MAG: hypothetical protein F4060_08775 [Holophagales bacterium]|nr:hypothetical protein [Holophagales bacterium]MYG29459.1 hypothetical protein [Holophagales bacterium]MYI80023.1 hypothetical protein [Holophagales bacterium]
MTSDHTSRDRSTARILGVFLAVLSIPVLIGGFSATETIDLALSTAAGAALLLAAAVLMLYGSRGRSKRTEKR